MGLGGAVGHGPASVKNKSKMATDNPMTFKFTDTLKWQTGSCCQSVSLQIKVHASFIRRQLPMMRRLRHLAS